MLLSEEEHIEQIMSGREKFRSFTETSSQGDMTPVEYLRTLIYAYQTLLEDLPIQEQERAALLYGANVEAEYLLKQMTYAE